MAWKLSLWFLIEWSRLKFLQCWRYFIELHLNVCIKWDQFDGFLISFSANLFLELFMEARLLDLGAYFHQTHKLAQMRILISKSRTKVYGNERNASWVSPHFRVILSEASLNKIPQRYEDKIWVSFWWILFILLKEFLSNYLCFAFKWDLQLLLISLRHIKSI